jgi:hypothetical protein
VYDKQQAQDRHRAVQTPPTDYYHHRIAELGLSEDEAQDAGIWPDLKSGDVLLYARKYNGEWRNIRPKRGGPRRPFTVRRNHPDKVGTTAWNISQVTGKKESFTVPKYISEPGHAPAAYPSPAAITAYQENTTGGTLAFIEGYFKALALSRAGIEAVAFGGLSLYKLDSETADYLTSRRPEVILVTYDGDALDVRRDKDTELITERRTRNFYASAAKFTAQLINHLASIEHKAKIVWVAVNPENPAKGADDLLAAAEDPLAVVGELVNRIEGENWTFTKLSPTTYEAKLKARFALTSAERFYHVHADKIGQQTFTFSGLDFRMDEGGLVMITNPFGVYLDIIPLTINEYLSEETATLDKLLATRKKLAIQADTKTGKTTFNIEWAKRTGRRLVIAVHTRALCKQLAEKHGILAVYGANSIDRAADAAAAQIVVATYDTVHHLPDLADRALVIDEAHNMINQYGQTRGAVKLFRAKTLNRLQQLAETAAQVVYLSGTMPKALLKAYNVPLVDVRRRNSPTVRLQVLKAQNKTTKAHTAALLSQLIKDIEDNPHQVHFALVNNTKELKKIRALLIASGRLQKSEIEVLSRTTYDAGETSAFDDLVELSEIRPGVRLVLCTSIIAEGVNIENTNVGKVYAVGVKCSDTVRQFAARFREMGDVDLCLILPPEREPGIGFSTPSGVLIEHMTTTAAAAAKLATTLSEAGHADSYDRSDIFPHIMPNEAGDGFTVDHLAILATERDRMLATAPTSYTVGRLLTYHGFTLATANQAPIDAKMEAGLKTANEALKAARDEAVATVRPILSNSPDNAIAALKMHYQRKGNRNSVNRLDVLAGDLLTDVNELNALAWLDEHEAALDFPEVRELIRRAAQLHFAGVIETGEWLAQTAREWNKTWQQIKTAFGLQALATRPRGIPAGLRLDLLAKRAIGAAWEAKKKERKRNIAKGKLNGTDNTSTDEQLAELIRDAIGRADKRTGMHRAPCLTTITKGRAVALIEELYQVDITPQGTKRLLTIGAKHSEVPADAGIVATCLSLIANPLKIKDLIGGS